MTYLANNADDYAATRVNIFFPASSNPPSGKDGDLTGQCVTLNKWFMAEMSETPSPFAARGDARYVGINLVKQGLADAVPAGQQKRGDIVCYEFGQYGHTGILLSGNRLFQQNAAVTGASKRTLADGTVVYSSTIVPLYASLGGVAPKFYRLKTYKEGQMAKFTKEQEQVAAIMATGYRPGSNYNYPFTVKDINEATVNEFLQTWQGRMTKITKEMENAVADGISGIKGYIGWNGYNSQFIGQPVVSHYPSMVQFWIDHKPTSDGKYELVTEPTYRKVK